MLQGSIPAWTSVIPEPGMPVFWVTLGPLGSIPIPRGEQTPGGHLAAPLLPGGTHLHLPAIACPCKGNSLLRANRGALPFLKVLPTSLQGTSEGTRKTADHAAALSVSFSV